MKKFFTTWISLLLTISVLAQDNPNPTPISIGSVPDGGKVLINSVETSTSSEGQLGLLFTILDNENNVITDVPIMNVRMRFNGGENYQGRVIPANSPKHITFLINTNQNMQDQLDTITNTIEETLETTTLTRNEISIIGFNQTSFESNANTITERLDAIITDSLEANSSSACVYDVLAHAIYQLEAMKEVERRAIVLITNDDEQGAGCENLELRGVYTEKITSLYILPLDGLHDSVEFILERQSDISGGLVYRIDTSRDFDNTIPQVINSLSQQQIAYTNVCLPEGNNTVELEIELANLNKPLLLTVDTFKFLVEEGCDEDESENLIAKITDLHPVLDTDANQLSLEPEIENESLIGSYEFFLRDVDQQQDWQIQQLDKLDESVELNFSGLPQGDYQLWVRISSPTGELLGYYYQVGLTIRISVTPIPSDTPLPSETHTPSTTSTLTSTTTHTLQPSETNTATTTHTLQPSETNTTEPTDTPIPTEETAEVTPVIAEAIATDAPSEITPEPSPTPAEIPTLSATEIINNLLAIAAVIVIGGGGAGLLIWWLSKQQDDSLTPEPLPNPEPLPMASPSTEANTYVVNAEVPSRPPNRPTPVNTRYQQEYQEAQVVVIKCKGVKKNKTFPIYRSQSFTIGREDPSSESPKPDLSCALDTVSRQHCEIAYDIEKGSYVVKHLGENTFTYIDDKYIGKGETAILRSGSIIRNAQQQRIDMNELEDWLELRFENLLELAAKQHEVDTEADTERGEDKGSTSPSGNDTSKNSPTPRMGLPSQIQNDESNTAMADDAAPDENSTTAIPQNPDTGDTQAFKQPDDENPTMRGSESDFE